MKENRSQNKHKDNFAKGSIFYLDKNNISGNNLVKNYYSLTFMLISYLRFNKIILLQKYNCFH